MRAVWWSAALALAGSLLSVPLAPAQAPPGFAFPQNFNTYRMTSAFDLDRDTGNRADWMGWISGDPTAGSGHAYDNHSGTDHGMPNATPLYAIANGTVTALYEDYPTNDTSGGGNYIFVSYSAGGHTYRVNNWHLDYQGVIPGVGQAVTKGQLIAYSNNTGNSTGPHLHYGISRSSATNLYTCPYYHGWWEEDEFYWGDTRPCLVYIEVAPSVTTLNCRRGNTTAYDVITTLEGGSLFVCSQQNSWWRIFLPMPPARPSESRTAAGVLAPGYSESGSWLNDASKTGVEDPPEDANRVTLAGLGSRYSSFSGVGGSDAATFTFTPTQRGNYDLQVSYPGAANAENVTYRVTHSGGTTDVVKHQRGVSGSPGSGTHADPYLIESNPYVAEHTTVGAESLWNSYSPCAPGVPEEGPEKIYRFTVYTTTSVSVSVGHAGYPDKDVDIHLLGSLSNTNCLVRNDWAFTYEVTPGTYYIAVDSYGSGSAGAARATDYTLTVVFGRQEPFADSWVSLGEYFLDRNTPYSVQILESSVTGPLNGALPGRVYADTLRVVPVITYRSGFASSNTAYTNRVNTAVRPLCSVVIQADRTSGNDSRDLRDYLEVPIYALPGGPSGSNDSPIVAKAVTGQRFVASERTLDGWYKIHLTRSTDALQGWISDQYLYVYNEWAAEMFSAVPAWRLY